MQPPLHLVTPENTQLTLVEIPVAAA